MTLFEIALSDREGSIDFYESGGYPNELLVDSMPQGWDLSGSIKQPHRHLAKHPWVTFDKKISVPTTTLDAVCETHDIGPIDFIWMDVQGAEMEVLRGAVQTLTKTRFLVHRVQRPRAIQRPAEAPRTGEVLGGLQGSQAVSRRRAAAQRKPHPQALPRLAPPSGGLLGDVHGFGINGRKAIVCASSRGLGRACALALAEAGVSLVINGRDPVRLDETAQRSDKRQESK